MSWKACGSWSSPEVQCIRICIDFRLIKLQTGWPIPRVSDSVGLMWSPKTCISRSFSWKKSHDKPKQHIKKQRYQFADRGPYSQIYGFSSIHARRWELDPKESWVLNNWCLWIVVLEKNLESPLDTEIKPVDPKGNWPWIFIGRTVAEAKTPILWPPDTKSWLIGKDSDAGKDWRLLKEVVEDEMVR